MDFKTEAHRRAFEKTREFLLSLYGEVNVREMDGTFALQEGTTFVYVRVLPIGENRAGVEVFSYVVVDVEPSGDLMKFLLTYNLKLLMGGFALAIGDDGKASVILTHTILGDLMDREELHASVAAVSGVANSLDEQLVSSFGGRTAIGELSESSPAELWE